MQRARKRVLQICFENDENDEDELVIFSIRRPRWIRERAEDFESLDDRDFITRYRLTKPTVLSILEKIEHQLEYETDRSVSEVCAYNYKTPSKYNSFFSTGITVYLRLISYYAHYVSMPLDAFKLLQGIFVALVSQL